MNQAEVEAYLELSGANIIGTDGSVREDITAWGGAAWKHDKRVFEWCTGKLGRTSSFRAECETHEDALVCLGKNTTRDDSVIILTDSLSLTSRLQTGKVSDLMVGLIDNINARFKTFYIPGHAGISYSEAADHLTGKAMIPISDITFHPSDFMQ